MLECVCVFGTDIGQIERNKKSIEYTTHLYVDMNQQLPTICAFVAHTRP